MKDQLSRRVGILLALLCGRAEPSGGGWLARGPVSAASWAELTPEGQQRQGVGVTDLPPSGGTVRGLVFRAKRQAAHHRFHSKVGWKPASPSASAFWAQSTQ